MGDLAEGWESFKAAGKLHKKERENINSHAIIKWCNENDVKVTIIETWHLRLTKIITIDIYPQSKKYHNVTTNERGKIHGKITAFLDSVFHGKK